MPIPNPQFDIGFELEGFIHRDHRQALNFHLNGLYGEFLAHAQAAGLIPNPIGNDASLERFDDDPAWTVDFAAIEIRTPPLPREQALQHLETLREYLSELTENQHFYTNETCGFHSSVSERTTFRRANTAHRELFAYRFLRRFKTDEWLQAFNRHRNDYANWTCRPESRKDMITQGEYHEHHTAINIENLSPDHRPEARRIEIRIAGGKNYHRHRRFSDYIDHISETLDYCASRPYPRRAQPVNVD